MRTRDYSFTYLYTFVDASNDHCLDTYEDLYALVDLRMSLEERRGVYLDTYQDLYAFVDLGMCIEGRPGVYAGFTLILTRTCIRS